MGLIFGVAYIRVAYTIYAYIRLRIFACDTYPSKQTVSVLLVSTLMIWFVDMIRTNPIDGSEIMKPLTLIRMLIEFSCGFLNYLPFGIMSNLFFPLLLQDSFRIS